MNQTRKIKRMILAKMKSLATNCPVSLSPKKTPKTYPVITKPISRNKKSNCPKKLSKRSQFTKSQAKTSLKKRKKLSSKSSSL